MSCGVEIINKTHLCTYVLVNYNLSCYFYVKPRYMNFEDLNKIKVRI